LAFALFSVFLGV